MIKGGWGNLLCRRKLWSRGLEDWLKEGPDERVFSFSVSPVQVTTFPVRAGVAWESPCRDVSSLALSSHMPVTSLCLDVLGAPLAIERSLASLFPSLLYFFPCIFSFSPYYFPALSFSFLNLPLSDTRSVTFAHSALFWDIVGYLGEREITTFEKWKWNGHFLCILSLGTKLGTFTLIWPHLTSYMYI